jgi:hypothetical protein
MRRSFLILLALVVTMLVCGDSATATTAPSESSATTTLGGPTPTPPGSSIPLTIVLQDSPFSDAKALLVTFSDVSAHASGGDFFAVPFTGGASSRTCDIKKLTTAQDVLGTGPPPAGHYTQLRLVVSSAAVYLDNGSAGPACAPIVAVPAGRSAAVDMSGELKLNREFDLASSGARPSCSTSTATNRSSSRGMDAT